MRLTFQPATHSFVSNRPEKSKNGSPLRRSLHFFSFFNSYQVGTCHLNLSFLMSDVIEQSKAMRPLKAPSHSTATLSNGLTSHRPNYHKLETVTKRGIDSRSVMLQLWNSKRHRSAMTFSSGD
jgi:hypothetical protein